MIEEEREETIDDVVDVVDVDAVVVDDVDDVDVDVVDDVDKKYGASRERSWVRIEAVEQLIYRYSTLKQVDDDDDEMNDCINSPPTVVTCRTSKTCLKS